MIRMGVSHGFMTAMSTFLPLSVLFLYFKLKVIWNAKYLRQNKCLWFYFFVDVSNDFMSMPVKISICIQFFCWVTYDDLELVLYKNASHGCYQTVRYVHSQVTARSCWYDGWGGRVSRFHVCHEPLVPVMLHMIQVQGQMRYLISEANLVRFYLWCCLWWYDLVPLFLVPVMLPMMIWNFT